MASTDLTDDEIKNWAGGRPWNPETRQGVYMAMEIQRHRAAQAADAERIKAVILTCIKKAQQELDGGGFDSPRDMFIAIATRAAERLATATTAPSTVSTARIEAGLAKLGAEHEPPAGWEQRVMDAADGTVSLNAEEAKLADDALGIWSSDYNDAPEDAIGDLRDRLRDFIAKVRP